MSSKYWDDFDRRIKETVSCLKTKKKIPIRRVAVFVTNRCNFKCYYCNISQDTIELSQEQFDEVVITYGKNAIIHITGGEPSIVKWLYKYIEEHQDIRFHLNTNAYIKPPKNIKRLKVSLDSNSPEYFNSLVCKKNAFDTVVKNIQIASKETVTSITCTLTKENYQQSPMFMQWCRKTFPDIYAVFFSVYKGNSARFKFTNETADTFFNKVKPKLINEMDKESLELLSEIIDEKRRIMEGVRFPENKLETPCYISMSEKVIDQKGNHWNCSHLFRDGILQLNNFKHVKCTYGCNRRLVAFNQSVEDQLK